MLTLSILLLGGCSENLSGTLVGDAPKGATVALLWPDTDVGLGSVGGIGEVGKTGFDIEVRQPDDQHPGIYYGTLVLYDGTLDYDDVLTADDIDRIVGAAPRHTIVDANSTCDGLDCERDDTFDRGVSCGVCDFEGCEPASCGKVELVATDQPLALEWQWPTVEPRDGVWTEAGQVVAVRDTTVQVFAPGEVEANVFRDDDAIASVEGVHVGAERVAVQVEDTFGKVRGVVRNFQGATLLDLREEGNALVDGPVLSPDGTRVATAWADGSVRVYDPATDDVVAETTVTGATQTHWAPGSDLVYVMTDVGAVPTAMPVLVGAVPVDWPECFDGTPTPTADPCGPNGEAGTNGDALGHPILIPETCSGTRFADLPRFASPVGTRLCAQTGEPSP